MKPQISVIMSVYNENLADLTLSVESILNQTYKNFEFIIIIDNPNNDIAINYIKQKASYDNRIRYYINEINMGLVKSLNKAIKLSKAPYTARMDADDISELNRLEIQLNYLLENETIDLVATNAKIINEEGIFQYYTNHKTKCIDHGKKTLRYNNNFMHPSWLLKSSVYDSLKGYREVKYCEDYDFLCRMALKGYNMMILPDYLLSYRIRSTGISQSNSLLQRKSMVNINKQYKKLLNSPIDKDIMINEIKVTNKETNEYTIAKKYWDESVICIKKRKYFTALSSLVMATVSSKYIRIRLSNNIKLKLLNIRYR